MVGEEYYNKNTEAYERAIETKEPKLTFEEKKELLSKLSAKYNQVMRTEISDKCCRTCDHFRDGCCAARNMAKVPEEVLLRAYGCKRWYEADFIPF